MKPQSVQWSIDDISQSHTRLSLAGLGDCRVSLLRLPTHDLNSPLLCSGGPIDRIAMCRHIMCRHTMCHHADNFGGNRFLAEETPRKKSKHHTKKKKRCVPLGLNDGWLVGSLGWMGGVDVNALLPTRLTLLDISI